MDPAKILDGKATSAKVLDACAQRVTRLVERYQTPPCLATVLVGDDPASVTYTRMKRKRCESVGMTSRKIELPAETDTATLVNTITTLSEDPQVHGILLQHPVPDQIDERAGFEAIAPEKDVDGVTFHSFATTSFAHDGFVACTPLGMIRLLKEYELPIRGLHAVVVGRSAILGKPMAMLLLNENATVTICHSRTKELAEHVRTADIVVAAVGRPNFVKGDWIKPGAIVLDAGYNPGNVGDVEQEAASIPASWITPVPGGVGPMTIAMLIEQTVTAAERQLQRHS